MSKKITATELRANLYRALDEVAETGVPLEIRRRDQVLLIIPATPPVRALSQLPRREVLGCSVDELVDTSWEEYWQSGP